ncbi:hypothetical protein CDD83_9882 [Cordyceps sp. RAO-2017]|nr:hypothetical protein CDD83_9882 [Cordyceps sp. RAO-2017]
MLNGGDALVGGDPTAAAVLRELRRLGVEVRSGVRADRVDPDPGKALSVSLSDGSRLATDLYLPTTGLAPNSDFLPPAFRTERGYVDVDDCMRVRAADAVWALGDVVSRPRPSFLATDTQAAGVAKNLELVLQGKDPRPVRGPPVDAFLCSIGRGRGAGRLGPVPVPSFLVWALKGRTLGMDKTPKYVSGAMW